jgi:lipopolysaccharide biosynthesis regulator YciM
LGDFILTFESQDLRRLTAAEGYIELGMYDEAAEELDQIDSSLMVSRGLSLRLCIYAGLEKWDLMEAVAEKLARHNPNDAQWAIWGAYAAAKGQSIEGAKKILMRALYVHPNDPRIHYVLSCYESRLHHFSTAKRHLARAIQLDCRLKLLALADEELEPLWSTIDQLDR